MTEKDRISKLFVQIIMENELSKMSLNDFRKAINDNLPKSISREAVERLRDEIKKLSEKTIYTDISKSYKYVVKKLDILLDNK